MPTKKSDEAFLTVAEVADRLRVSERSVRRWVKEGSLRVHRLGRAIRISEHDLRSFLREQK